ncbi:hypothetical protein H7I77_11490 [Mycolicibacterium novocastrense]|nr:hypothetical protein [Mycolicibacterium novocastrense]MCV7023965.1 hypothetical protein [Mycolicibacterium novocastrense]
MTDSPPLLHRLMIAGCAGAFLALSWPASAAAAPDDGTWDVEQYDNCMKQTVRNADLCCVDSGGVPTSDPNDTQSDGSPNCYAPPAQAQQAEQQPAAPMGPGAVRGDLPVLQLPPAQPAQPQQPVAPMPPRVLAP